MATAARPAAGRPATAASDPDRRRRFEQEAKAAGALHHPNLLAVYDVGSHENAPYIVSEKLEGETLRARKGAPDLTPRKAVEYSLQAARGLAAAHQPGIVHRHLKPENLFVCRDGTVKILDFGLAKLRGERDEWIRGPDGLVPDPPGHDRGNGLLHVAGAGARATRRSAFRHLLAGRGALRRTPSIPT